MRYFFDNNISHRFARMLSALGQDVVALRDELPQNIQDPDLLHALSSRDIVLVSADRAMRRGLVTAPLLRAAGVTSLFFGPFWPKMEFWPQAEWLIRRWPTIESFARGAAKGTCAEVKRNGKSELFRL